MYCGKCGKVIDDTAVVCPWCGASTEDGHGSAGSPELDKMSGKESSPRNPSRDKRRLREAASGQMTEIGITVALFAALIYWSGLITEMPVITVLLAGYVLIREKEQWLRAVALKAVTIIVCFALLLGFINLLVYFKDVMVNIINMMLSTISADASYRQVTGAAFRDILDILRYIILFVRDIFLILSGFMALKYKNMRIPVIDKMVNRHIGRMSGSAR